MKWMCYSKSSLYCVKEVYSGKGIQTIIYVRVCARVSAHARSRAYARMFVFVCVQMYFPIRVAFDFYNRQNFTTNDEIPARLSEWH